MQFKNISGVTKSMGFGSFSSNSAVLPDQILTFDGKNMEQSMDYERISRAALRQCEKGNLRVLRGPATSAFQTSSSQAPSAVIHMDTIVNSNTVTIGGITFEFRVSGNPTAGNVKVVLPTADQAGRLAAANNLKTAINAHATLNSKQVVATDVLAESSTLFHLVVTVRRDGEGEYFPVLQANEVVVTSGQSTITVDGPGCAVKMMAAGTDGHTLTLAGNVYEFDNNATVSGGNITVTIGASALLTAQALRTAINANIVGYTATADVTDGTITYVRPTTSTSTSIRKATSNAASAALLNTLVLGGSASIGYRFVRLKTIVTGTKQYISTGLNGILEADIFVRPATGGVAVACDAVITYVGGTIFLNSTGSANLAAGQILVINAYGF